MGNIWRIRTEITGGVGGTPYVSTMYFGTGLYVLDDALSAVGDFWTGVKGQMSTASSITVSGSADVIDDATGDLVGVESGTPPGTMIGGSSGDPCPPATQALIQWQTSTVVAGRVLRGRTFIPNITENDATGGKPSNDLKSAYLSAAQALIDDVGSEFRIWSRAHGQSALATGRSVWSEFAVLRSRRD